MKLLDRLLVWGTDHPGGIPSLFEPGSAPENWAMLLRHAVPIEATNVANWCRDLHRAGKDMERAFNNILPPFECCWIEYDWPGPEGSVCKIGCLVLRGDSSLIVHGACHEGNNLGFAPIFYQIAFDEQGELIDVHILERGKGMLKSEDHPKEHKQSVYLILPALSAISFFHCKNARLIRHERPAGKQKEHRRRHGGDFPSFRTIEVHLPGRQRTTAELFAHTRAGAERRAHFVRGHFKEFGEQFGTGKLFGRVEGRFFWTEHVAGVGQAAKPDYRVHPPVADHESQCVALRHP